MLILLRFREAFCWLSLTIPFGPSSDTGGTDSRGVPGVRPDCLGTMVPESNGGTARNPEVRRLERVSSPSLRAVLRLAGPDAERVASLLTPTTLHLLADLVQQATSTPSVDDAPRAISGTCSRWPYRTHLFLVVFYNLLQGYAVDRKLNAEPVSNLLTILDARTVLLPARLAGESRKQEEVLREAPPATSRYLIILCGTDSPFWIQSRQKFFSIA